MFLPSTILRKPGHVFDQAVFEARGAIFFADDGIFKCGSGSEQVLTFHVIDNFFSRFHDVFAVVEVANDEISVFFYSLSQCFRVCEDVIGFPRREDIFPKYEFFPAHPDFCAVGYLKGRHNALLIALVGYFRYCPVFIHAFRNGGEFARDAGIFGVVNDVAKFIRIVCQDQRVRIVPSSNN